MLLVLQLQGRSDQAAASVDGLSGRVSALHLGSPHEAVGGSSDDETPNGGSESQGSRWPVPDALKASTQEPLTAIDCGLNAAQHEAQ